MRRIGPIFFKGGGDKLYRRKLLGIYEQLTGQAQNKFFNNKKRRADGTLIRSIGIPMIGGAMLYKSYITTPPAPAPASTTPEVCYEYAFLTGIATNNIIFPDLTIWNEVTDFDEGWNAGSCNWYNLDGTLIISWAPQSRRYFTNGGPDLYCKNEAILKDDDTQLVAPTLIKGAAFNATENLLYVAGYIDKYIAIYKISATHDGCGVITASGDWTLIQDGIWDGKEELEAIEDGRGFLFNASATQFVFLTDFYKMIVCDVTPTEVTVNQVYSPVTGSRYAWEEREIASYTRGIEYDRSLCLTSFPWGTCSNTYGYVNISAYIQRLYTPVEQIKLYNFADFKGDALVYAYTTKAKTAADRISIVGSSATTWTAPSTKTYRFSGQTRTGTIASGQNEIEFHGCDLPVIAMRGIEGNTIANYSYGPSSTDPASELTIYASSIETTKIDLTNFEWHYLDLRHDYACFKQTGYLNFPVQPYTIERYSGYRLRALKGSSTLLSIDVLGSYINSFTSAGDDGRDVWSLVESDPIWWAGLPGYMCSCSPNDQDQVDSLTETGSYNTWIRSGSNNYVCDGIFAKKSATEGDSILFSSLPDESSFFICGSYSASGYQYVGDLYVNGELVADLSAQQFTYPRLIQTDKRV